MSQFYEELSKLKGKKVRFYTGGGEKGFVQGPVERVEGDLIYVEKAGEIRGTLHALTIHASQVRYYEIDIVTRED